MFNWPCAVKLRLSLVPLLTTEFSSLNFTFSFPKYAPYVKFTSTRTTSGQCLGIFKTGRKNVFPPPLNEVSLRPHFVFSLSLCLSLFNLESVKLHLLLGRIVTRSHFKPPKNFFFLQSLQLLVVILISVDGEIKIEENDSASFLVVAYLRTSAV
jgi:hypothetical protein